MLEFAGLDEMDELDEDLLFALRDSLSAQENTLLSQEAEEGSEVELEDDTEAVEEEEKANREEREAIEAGMKPTTVPDDDESFVELKDIKVFERMEK